MIPTFAGTPPSDSIAWRNHFPSLNRRSAPLDGALDHAVFEGLAILHMAHKRRHKGALLGGRAAAESRQQCHFSAVLGDNIGAHGFASSARTGSHADGATVGAEHGSPSALRWTGCAQGNGRGLRAAHGKRLGMPRGAHVQDHDLGAARLVGLAST
jgi:hypothetical protein